MTLYTTVLGVGSFVYFPQTTTKSHETLSYPISRKDDIIAGGKEWKNVDCTFIDPLVLFDSLKTTLIRLKSFFFRELG